jgi:uncharacterized protein YmfQ (DUF2313 family)
MPVLLGGDNAGLLAAYASALDLVDSAAADFLNEILPDMAHDTIADWERVFGIVPPAGSTLAQRQQALVLAMCNKGGLSRQHFIAIAALMGQTITITEYIVPRCGVMQCGTMLCTPTAAWMWTVSGLNKISVSGCCGTLCCGEPLGAIGVGVEGIFNALKPAHTLVNFVYTGVSTPSGRHMPTCGL